MGIVYHEHMAAKRYKSSEGRLEGKPLLEKLRLIIESSHNGYTFRYRCKGQNIVIERRQDGAVVAYYDDGRDGQIALDLEEPPFDRIKFFLRNE